MLHGDTSLLKKIKSTPTPQSIYGLNILIKDCSNKKPFKDRNFIRIAVRSKKENQIIVNALKLL